MTCCQLYFLFVPDCSGVEMWYCSRAQTRPEIWKRAVQSPFRTNAINQSAAAILSVPALVWVQFLHLRLESGATESFTLRVLLLLGEWFTDASTTSYIVCSRLVMSWRRETGEQREGSIQLSLYFAQRSLLWPDARFWCYACTSLCAPYEIMQYLSFMHRHVHNVLIRVSTASGHEDSGEHETRCTSIIIWDVCNEM